MATWIPRATAATTNLDGDLRPLQEGPELDCAGGRTRHPGRRPNGLCAAFEGARGGPSSAPDPDRRLHDADSGSPARQCRRPPDLIAKAGQWADNELTKYPATITSDLITTNKAIVEALANVLSKNNQSRNDFFIMNLSWVVVGPVLDVRLPTPLGGVIVVSAGNDPGVNVNTARIDLAQRSLTDHHVLAVMNLNRAGAVMCDSSEVDQTFAAQMFAVGFDGRVDNTTCGTSFSAPRVAFLIATFQATRPRVPDVATWNADLFSRFLRVRSGNSGLSQFLLDPIAFLNQP